MERGESAYDSTRVKRPGIRTETRRLVSFKGENVKPSRHNHGFRYTRRVQSQTRTYTEPPPCNVLAHGERSTAQLAISTASFTAKRTAQMGKQG